MKNKFNDKIVTKDNTDIYSLNIEHVNSYPIKVSMTAINLLANNLRTNSSYFEFSEQLHNFITENKSQYKQLLKEEIPVFSELLNVYINHMTGPLYQDANQVFSYIDRLYDLEAIFVNNNINQFDDIPQIIWKTKKTVDGLELDIKNIQQLNDLYGQPIMRHMTILFKDQLNHEHELATKSNNKPYTISTNLIKQFFNKETKQHENLESFNGKDYFLTQFFDSAQRVNSSPEDILQLLLVREQLRKLVVEETLNIENKEVLKKLKK